MSPRMISLQRFTQILALKQPLCPRQEKGHVMKSDAQKTLAESGILGHYDHAAFINSEVITFIYPAHMGLRVRVDNTKDEP